LALARELVVHVKRSGEHEQYSEALKFQIQSSDRFADLPAWILSHLSDDLSVALLLLSDSGAQMCSVWLSSDARAFGRASTAP
jgi:hypothetical protein